ncbi:heavy-metal-associated domain-containing protein [Salinivirga cyanobacteriivorans]
MKFRTLVLLATLFLGTLNLPAQGKTEKFKVYGNCGMCENRIEKAAKSIDGVSMADWDKSTEMLEVSFNSGKTNVDAIQRAIVKVGHDTKKYKADDKTYEGLPGCCKYERPEE